VAEGLGEVVHHPTGSDVVLLGEQADVVAERKQPLEDRQGLVASAHQHQAVGVPVGRHQERAFTGRQAVDAAVVGLVALHEAVDGQLAPDGVDGAHDARIVGWQEADERNHQKAGVERGGVVGLHERMSAGVVALLAHLGMDLVALRAPLVDRTVAPVLLDRGDRPVGRHPRHHLGVREVSPRAAHLPDAVVGFAPHLAQVIHNGALHAPGLIDLRVGRVLLELLDHRRLTRHLGDVHDLTEDVELELVVGAVADAHRR
jgi:hypothetical protein